MNTPEATYPRLDIHVLTQYRENYGTDEAPYWKYKGGRTIVLTGYKYPTTGGLDAAGEAAVESVRSRIEYANPMAEERILDWEYKRAGSLTEYEECQIKFDGKIVSADDRIDLQK